MKIDIQVSAQMPEAGAEGHKHTDLCQKVKDYMFVCESDDESEHHWRYLKCLYKKLKEKKRLPEVYHNLLGELDSFMSKYAQQDSGDDQVQLEGKDMFRYKDEA